MLNLKLIFPFVILLMTAIQPHSATALPSSIKHCVIDTAEDIQNAESAHDLINRLYGKVHRFILGSRTYKMQWSKIEEQGKGGQAIAKYLSALYWRAIKDSTTYTGQAKQITIIGASKKQIWDSHRTDRKKVDAYEVVVRVSTKTNSNAATVIVLAIQKGSGCLFGDIMLVVGSSEIWFSNNVGKSFR